MYRSRLRVFSSILPDVMKWVYAGLPSVFSRISRLQFGHFAACSKT